MYHLLSGYQFAVTLLSRKADYALLILGHLHQTHGGGNARTVSEKFGLSRPFTANILKELCRKGFVTSQRGVKGGYTLQSGVGKLSLADLLRGIDEEFELTVCSSIRQAADSCSLEGSCPVKAPLSEIHRRVQDVFRGVTLQELFTANLNVPGPPVFPLLRSRESGSLVGNATATVGHPCT